MGRLADSHIKNGPHAACILTLPIQIRLGRPSLRLGYFFPCFSHRLLSICLLLRWRARQTLQHSLSLRALKSTFNSAFLTLEPLGLCSSKHVRLGTLSHRARAFVQLANARTAPNIVTGLLVKPFTGYGKAKTVLRVIYDKLVQTLLDNIDLRQARLIFGTSAATYAKYVGSKGFPELVEDVGEGARLMWVGEKKTRKVILYLHGGAFFFTSASPDYWDFVRGELRKRGVEDVGLAMLNYSRVLIPPTGCQLTRFRSVRARCHIPTSAEARRRSNQASHQSRRAVL